jgi:hypothetical protein
MMRVKWKLDSVRLKIALISTEDRCTVYAEQTKCLKIVLYAPEDS